MINIDGSQPSTNEISPHSAVDPQTLPGSVSDPHAAENSAPASEETRLSALSVAHLPIGLPWPSPAHLALPRPVVGRPAEENLPRWKPGPHPTRKTLRRPFGPPRKRQTRQPLLVRRILLARLVSSPSTTVPASGFQMLVAPRNLPRRFRTGGGASGLRGSSPGFSQAGGCER